MKIRNKITVIFTVLTGSLLLGIFLFIYYFTYRYTQNEFYERLKERANIAAQFYFEEDEFSTQVYNRIREQHMQILPEEKEAYYTVNISQLTLEDKSASEYPDFFYDQIFRNNYAELKTGVTFHTGILYADNQGDFIVVVSAQDRYGQTKMKYLRNILIVAFLFGLGGIFFLGRYYAGRALKPISAITKKANEITASNLHLRIHTGTTKDELSELANTFNNMLDRLESSFETQNNFINNASHELRNPLTAILGETEVVLKKERSGEEYKESFHVIEKEAHRLNLLVNSLLKMAQMTSERQGLIIEPVRIDELLIEILQDRVSLDPYDNIILDFSKLTYRPDSLLIQGNQNLLKAAISNIFDNACKFSMNKKVSVKLVPLNNVIKLAIKDQGIGIPENELANITEPFFRASNARSFTGIGVGLALSQKIIKLHGGTMKITSELMKGTEVIISFPNTDQHVYSSQ
ncbi:MAG: HAMP domain-containing protein [Cyclobacteriaceae bacterium]|nr:HAMP domain-containing protein [Cyclobacteriaceae bacterium]